MGLFGVECGVVVMSHENAVPNIVQSLAAAQSVLWFLDTGLRFWSALVSQHRFLGSIQVMSSMGWCHF